MTARYCSFVFPLLLASCAGAPQSGAPVAEKSALPEKPAVSQPQKPDEDANQAIASGVPGTDIYLLDLAAVLRGQALASVANISNRRGYDNQPAFAANGTDVYFASIRDGQQADVFVYDILSQSTRQLTRSPESEFSPTPQPGGSFTTVRVDADGGQYLWRYDATGKPVEVVRPDLADVGYHARLDDRHVAVFRVADPPVLSLARIDGVAVLESPVDVASNIGRALHRVPNSKLLSYVQKQPDGQMTIMHLDPATGSSKPVAATLAGQEDLTYLADGSILMANGRSLYRRPVTGSDWELLIDLSQKLPGDIGRLAASPSNRYLALVVGEAE